MGIKIVPGIESAIPRWHMMLNSAGRPAFRRFLEKYNASKYRPGELTVDGVLRYELFRKFALMLHAFALKPSIAVRDLTDCGWWKGSQGPDGDMKEIVDSDAGSSDRFLDSMPCADREADVALNAIEAYRAYVAAGGDREQVPVLKFVDGKFVVELKPYEES